jgi:negative regulator of flagellin synthesis FlgM
MLTGLEARLNRWQVVSYDAPGLTEWLSFCVAKIAGSHQEGRVDMDVRGVGSVPGTTPARPTAAPSGPRETATPKPRAPRDELELSQAGKMLDQLSQDPDVRQERITRIKEAIANGTYDTDEKLQAALLKLFDAHGIEIEDE